MLEEIIRRVPLFATLPPRHIRWLAETLQPQDVPAGGLLFAEGERGDTLYVILQGEFEILKRREDGGDEVIAKRGSGEYIGEMSLLQPMGLRSVSARAVGDAEVLSLTRGDFDALLRRYPVLGYELARELGQRLEQANERAIRRLEDRNRALQAALDELHRAQAELVEKQKLEHELALARDIQMSLLPHALPSIGGFDFGARLLPMSQVGGDFYDFIELGGGDLGIAVGDVSGHGVPAALIMAITVALLRAEASRSVTPGEALRAVNRELLRLSSRRMFVTVLYGVLDGKTGEFVYARAGHEAPLVLLPGATPRLAELFEGRMLGLFEDIAFADHSLALPPGGSLVLFTDGVIEARSAERDFFGEERLTDLALQALTLPAQAVCDSVMAAVAAHTGSLAQQDDITVVCAKRLNHVDPREPEGRDV